jgi:hypothetical protein
LSRVFSSSSNSSLLFNYPVLPIWIGLFRPSLLSYLNLSYLSPSPLAWPRHHPLYLCTQPLHRIVPYPLARSPTLQTSNLNSSWIFRSFVSSSPAVYPNPHPVYPNPYVPTTAHATCTSTFS